MTGTGFETYFSAYDWEWTSAHEFRERHTVRAIRELSATLMAAFGGRR
ncbi:MAG: hypothetical protein WDN25_13420 [Acetobacteraceae bacterium]